MADENQLPRTNIHDPNHPRPQLASVAAMKNRSSPHRSTAQSPNPPSLTRRRSSLLSFSSIDDAAKSLADDLINPRTGTDSLLRDGQDEVTHWHSTPLVFAILPALAGLLFKNGSTFVTDALLLGLAAIFLNWSVRLPWDWYYASQATLDAVAPDDDDDTIIEEDELMDAETAAETGSSVGSSPNQGPGGSKIGREATGSDVTQQGVTKHEKAATDLRRQELLALGATFVLPCLAAYLLHVIRAQLSRPSTGLVSDYNLSIFILAAEIRPCRQLCRLIAKRTLHLRRAATGHDDLGVDHKTTVSALVRQVNELESRLSDHSIIPPSVSIAQKADVSELQTEMKKRYEPRFEGLERAVRRYEKRSTTFTMSIEQRLLALEGRTNDAFSLAAVAAQNSRNRSLLDVALDLATSAAVFPIKFLYSTCKMPFIVAEEAYNKLKVLLLGPAYARTSRSTKRSNGSARFADRDDKGRAKYSMRKPASRDVLRAGASG